jgi:hypothetical protein
MSLLDMLFTSKDGSAGDLFLAAGGFSAIFVGGFDGRDNLRVEFICPKSLWDGLSRQFLPFHLIPMPAP